MTKTAKHSLLFRVWIHIRGLLALVIVLFGILVGLISLILPNEELYKQYVVDFLTKQWNKQVKIEKISGKWQGFGPKFIIDGLVIKDTDEVTIQQATLNINVFKYILPEGSTGISLEISDIEVDLEQKASGQIVLENNEEQQSFSQQLEKLLATGALSIKNLSLNLHDPHHQTKNKINSEITVQQSTSHRAFALELHSKELANQVIIKSITEKPNDFMQQARWYVETDNLSLSNLGKLIHKSYLPRSLVDAQLWFATNQGNIVKLIAKAKLHHKLFNSNPEDYDIKGMAELIYQGNKHDWSAELSIADIKTKSISQDKIIIQLARKDSFIYINADVLDIPLLKAITQIVNISSTEFDSLVLHGKLTDVTIKYDVNLRRIVAAKINFHQLDLAAEFGQFTNISGVVSLQNEQIRLLIDADAGTADIPNFIRGQVKWDKLLVSAQTSMQDDDLDIRINSLWCDCNDFILDGAARFTFDEQLFVDLSVAVYDAKVNQLYKYWPSNIWKPNVLNFLDTALVEGVVENGMIIYHGLVSEHPFNHHQGVFLTRSNLTGATVNYHKDWPMVKNFHAIVDTINQKLIVKSSQGQVVAAQINQVTAVIANFKEPLLTVAVNASGNDNFLIDFLNQSPMQAGLNVLDEDIVLSGVQQIKVDIELPLDKPHINVEPSGTINFSQTNFQIGQFQLQDLTGAITFSGFSLILQNLTAKFLNQAVTVTGKIINEPDKEPVVDVLLDGNYDITTFETVLGFKLPAIGSSAWLFSIANTNSDEISFKAESDLIGTQLDMPQPFTKPAEQLTPLSITCILPCIDSDWNIDFADKLTSSFNFAAKTGEFQLNKLIFGSANKENLEAKFGGQLDVVNVDEWIDILVNNKPTDATNSFPFKQMSLHINKAIFMARELLDINLKIAANDDGIILDIDGRSIKGRIIIANDIDRKGITVQLEKLHWQAQNTATATETIPQHHISQVSKDYPALHIWIGDFIYDGIPLGETRIEVRPVTEGIRVEKFDTKSALMQLNINGIWLRNQGERGSSKFNIIMTSPDIAKFLEKLGFAAPISQAKTIIDMQAQWQDFPSQFEIKNISGTMRVEIGKGEVVDAKPGMGRILGLFSLTNLPRRLILDFKDVFGKGLTFQSMQGDFTLKDGVAHTDAFVIDSSSAQIIITGKTGLASQDYDQMVVVIPRVGRILPTIGVIAGGAVGAAAGFLVQGMFRKGLKNIGKIVYKVTGSWDEPIIELIATESKDNNIKNEK
ncbi:hypothetical protein MNBD_GAMMA01-1239 [hydrothermal vent metagenome]|uniref:YhdP central domain-containing protein n=1 Tax=hydrothermal vent metagenome TaxID=652676 RepID=A0A3B0V074_9ZZZZ